MLLTTSDFQFTAKTAHQTSL